MIIDNNPANNLNVYKTIRMEVPNDIKRQLLFTLHPYTSELCDVNSEYRTLCNNKLFLRQLMERWLFPDQKIPKDYPALSYSQIATHALFYHPIPESIDKFNPTSLYYRAGLVYNEEKCRYFFEHAINYNFQLGDIGYDGIKSMLMIADNFGHRTLLKETYDRFILRLRPNDPTERQRKIICMLCALLEENKNKFKLAYNLYMEGQLEDEESASSNLINSLQYIYIPDYDIVSLANLIANMLTWITEEEIAGEIFEADRVALEDFQRGLSRAKTVNYSRMNEIGYQLSLCMNNEDLLKFVPSLKPIPKDGKVYIQMLADYWKIEDLQDLETIEIFTCRPDLLEEIQLFSISYTNYIQADSYYYYLMYSEFISDDKPSIYSKNHLNVTGYNSDLVARAKRVGMAPDYYADYTN